MWKHTQYTCYSMMCERLVRIHKSYFSRFLSKSSIVPHQPICKKSVLISMNILQGEKKHDPPPIPLFFYLGAHLLIDVLQAQHFLCIPVYNNEVLYDHVN